MAFADHCKQLRAWPRAEKAAAGAGRPASTGDERSTAACVVKIDAARRLADPLRLLAVPP
jgi:hypothetical protein